MKFRTASFIAALLLLPASALVAQPVITSVVFKANSPQAVVASSTSSNGQMQAGCTGNWMSTGTVDRTCSGVNLAIQGRISPPSLVFTVIKGTFTGMYYYNSAPGSGCNTATVNIFYGTSQSALYSGCMGSNKFTLTVNADGSIALKQQ